MWVGSASGLSATLMTVRARNISPGAELSISYVGSLRRMLQQTSQPAAGPDAAAFTGLVDRHRHELLVHCYRMLGSFEEAEDMVQETFLRAWRGRDAFEGRAALRTWLYRIATNACLDASAKGRRPCLLPTAETAAGQADSGWLQPFPDGRLDPTSPNEEQPEARVVAKETIELAFLVALQHLPPRQRAVLVLRDVVGWSAQEAADMLEVTTASVNSVLQRARSTMRTHLPPRSRHEWSPSRDLAVPEQQVLDRFMAAVESADIAAITDLISEDAVGCMPPYPLWYEGRDAIVEAVAGSFDRDADDYVGEFRLVATRANGCPAAALYLRAPGDPVYRAWAINVLRVERGRIAELTSFLSPQLFPAFGLPATIA
jgi:RNA polymerase sigma-70 factor (ECF subfamily)